MFIIIIILLSHVSRTDRMREYVRPAPTGGFTWRQYPTIEYAVCVQHHTFECAVCVFYFILCVDHQLLLPSGRLPPPLIESNQINHKNKWYSHLVIPKCVVIWLLDTHKPWLFQYEYEWVRTLFVMITNTISNYCFTQIYIQTQVNLLWKFLQPVFS